MKKSNLSKKIGDKYVLNAYTIKVLEESRLGIGVKSYKSLEELYKDLGID